MYTGPETKIMKNSFNLRYKKSKVELGVYKEIMHIVILQIVLSIIGAFYGTIWLWNNKTTHTYIELNSDYSDSQASFTKLFF